MGDVVSPLGTATLAALLAVGPLGSATPSATPSPAASGQASPLREIGRVRATTAFCKTALQHAAAGIDAVLEDDRTLAEIETGLRSADLDKSVLAKNAVAAELNRRYVAYRAAAIAGNAELLALRREAKNAPTEAQAKALKSLASALDGAVVRQRKLADDVGRLVVYIDNHPPLDQDARDQIAFNAIAAENGKGIHPAQGPLSTVPDSLTTIAKEGADELQIRALPIATDENDAAARIDPAFDAC